MHRRSLIGRAAALSLLPWLPRLRPAATIAAEAPPDARFQRVRPGDPGWPGEAAKAAYDPAGLFVVHHGVGSEAWSADGFTPIR
jgi:hypothetical protein